jgi:hypothetical protein
MMDSRNTWGEGGAFHHQPWLPDEEGTGPKLERSKLERDAEQLRFFNARADGQLRSAPVVGAAARFTMILCNCDDSSTRERAGIPGRQSSLALQPVQQVIGDDSLDPLSRHPLKSFTFACPPRRPVLQMRSGSRGPALSSLRPLRPGTCDPALDTLLSSPVLPRLHLALPYATLQSWPTK